MYVKVKTDIIIKNHKPFDINIKGEVVNVKESADDSVYYCYDYNCYIQRSYCVELDKYRDNLISDIIDVE